MKMLNHLILYFVSFCFISGEVADAIRKNTDMHFGLYHSLFEWFNPIFEQDRANGFKTQDFVSVSVL